MSTWLLLKRPTPVLSYPSGSFPSASPHWRAHNSRLPLPWVLCPLSRILPLTGQSLAPAQVPMGSVLAPDLSYWGLDFTLQQSDFCDPLSSWRFEFWILAQFDVTATLWVWEGPCSLRCEDSALVTYHGSCSPSVTMHMRGRLCDQAFKR